jgi:alpha-mannosidase
VFASTEQRLERLRVRVEELEFWRARAWVDLARWTFDGTALALGQRWPSLEGVVRLEHPEVEVPREWPLEQVRLELDVGGEGLVRVMYANGSTLLCGLDPWHRSWALEHRRFALEVEAVARLPLGHPHPHAALRSARIVHFEGTVERLCRSVRLICETVVAVGDHELVSPLLECAEEALASLKWPSGTASYLARTGGTAEMASLWSRPEIEGPLRPLAHAEIESLEAASARLTAALRELRSRYPHQGSIALTGHAHLDVAWLWPLAETRRKALRSWHTAVGLLGAYAELRFNQSSAQLYAFVEQDDPALFERVQKLAEEGRWEAVGGMWVEPDINMPSGEALVRQLLYGQRYFQQRLGAAHTVCWLPDCFGFSPALPQLLTGAGIRNFVTIKVNWSETNKLPYDLFWWEGLDGSRVLAHTFDNPDLGYNGDPRPQALVATWNNYRGKHTHPESLLSIGRGDGGGGPTEDMIETVRALEAFPRVPALRFCLVHDFFEEVQRTADLSSLPTWVGELYLEYHRGTLTTQSRIKYLNRRAERDLTALEVLGAMVALAGGGYPPPREDLWRILLRNQFHDILPGSGIAEIYEEATAELSHLIEDAADAIRVNLDSLERRLGTPGREPALFVVNPDLSARPLRVLLADQAMGAQRVEHGFVLADASTVGGLTARSIVTVSEPGPVSASPERLENGFVRVDLSSDGTLRSVYDKIARREMLADRANQIWAYVDKPRAFDAWEIDAAYTEAGQEIRASGPHEIVESGPHRVAVRIQRRFRASRITQTVRLWANSPRIEFHTVIEWHDRRWLVKARFPVAVRSMHAIFETAFGTVARPTYRNTSWDAAQFEVAGHRFVDLAEPGYGVALLNTGKYGHHAVGNELGLTLLRSPVYPDPCADEGRQEFTYALLGHRGGWLEGGVLAEAEDLNRPLLVRRTRARADAQWTPLSLDGLPLGLGALKPLEDGDGLVLRVYEPQGARGAAQMALPTGWSAEAELDLLENETGPVATTFEPFKVRSWRLRRVP